MQLEEDVSLRLEIDAAPGSFVAAVRFDLCWDTEKFVRLCRALHHATKQHVNANELPRDLSQLFWYCGTFIPLWLAQRDFRVGQPVVDYDKVVKILRDLGNAWFGDNGPIDDQAFEQQLLAL